MKTIKLTIDEREVSAPEGTPLLWVALEHGIYIPNLCALEDARSPAASCRLCFVEVAGRAQPVLSCAEPASEGMVVNTRGAQARRLARASAELLLASHPIDCGHCPANRRCDLQKIAAHLGLKLKSRRLRAIVHNRPRDDSSAVFTFDANKCVLCGRCVWICHERERVGAIGMARRGFDRRVTTFGDVPISESPCTGCGSCVLACPAGALVFKPPAIASGG